MNKVKEIREAQGMSIAALAKRSGVSGAHLSDIENNYKKPTIKVMCKISKALKIPCWDIFDCENEC